MVSVILVIQLVLGILFVGAGLIKCNPKSTSKDFERFDFPKWFKYVSGIIEIGSGLLVLYGLIHPTAAAWGGGLIAITMIGAVYSQLKVGDSFKNILFPLIVLGLSLFVLVLNWSSLFNF